MWKKIALLWPLYGLLSPHTIRGRRRWKWLFYALCQTNEFVFRETTTISIWSFSKEAASFHTASTSASASIQEINLNSNSSSLLGLCIWKLRAALTWMPRVVRTSTEAKQSLPELEKLSVCRDLMKSKRWVYNTWGVLLGIQNSFKIH